MAYNLTKNQRSKLLAKLEFGKEEVVPPKDVFLSFTGIRCVCAWGY